jgi:surface polysaccharide O-acyltransferase-like enzyme
VSSKEFHQNVHSLRALAIWSIVAGHVIDITSWPANSIWPAQLSNLLENGSVLFVFVAGYLFQHLHSRYRYLHYLKRKVARVIVPYLIVSTPAVILALSFGNVPEHYPQLAGRSLGFQIDWMYLTGGSHVNFALWFIPMISIFYVAAPLFSAMIRHPVSYWILPPLVVLSAVIHRVPNPSLGIVHMTLYLLPAYVAGMWCSQFGAALSINRALSATGLWIALVGDLALPSIVSSHVGNYEEPGYLTFTAGIIDWLFLARLAAAFLLLAVLARMPVWLSRRLAPFAATSFGVFFIHCYWLQLFVQLQRKVSLPGNILIWLLTTIAIIAASHWSVNLVDRLFPRAGGYLVGYFRRGGGEGPARGPVPVEG